MILLDRFGEGVLRAVCSYIRSRECIVLIRTLKRAFDLKAILNPGNIL